MINHDQCLFCGRGMCFLSVKRRPLSTKHSAKSHKYMVRVIAIFTTRSSLSLASIFIWNRRTFKRPRAAKKSQLAAAVHPPALEWRNKTFVCFAHPLALAAARHARSSFGWRKGRKNHVTWRLKDLMAPGRKTRVPRAGFICSFFIVVLERAALFSRVLSRGYSRMWGACTRTCRRVQYVRRIIQTGNAIKCIVADHNGCLIQIALPCVQRSDSHSRHTERYCLGLDLVSCRFSAVELGTAKFNWNIELMRAWAILLERTSEEKAHLPLSHSIPVELESQKLGFL